MIDVERLRKACEREGWEAPDVASGLITFRAAPAVVDYYEEDEAGAEVRAYGPLRLVCRMIAALAECEVDDG